MAIVYREANWGTQSGSPGRKRDTSDRSDDAIRVERSELTRRPIKIDDVDDAKSDESVTVEVVAKFPDAKNFSVIAVTADPDLRAALAEIAPKGVIRFLDSAEQVSANPIPSNCAVLIVEQSAGRAAFEQLKAHVKKSAPAVVNIVIGTYDDGGSLVRMLAAGQIDRFMVKPLNLGLARTALRSALQQHHSLRSKLKLEQTPSLDTPLERATVDAASVNSESKHSAKVVATESTNPHAAQQNGAAVARHAEMPPLEHPAVVESSTRKRSPVWVLAAAAAAIAVIGLAAWFALPRAPNSADNALVNKIVASHLTTAERAFELGSYVDPPELSAAHFYTAALELDPSNLQARRGLDSIADRLVEESNRLIANGDLLRAQTTLDSVRRLEPTHPELPQLTASLLAARESERRTLQAAQVAANANVEEIPLAAPLSIAPNARAPTTKSVTPPPIAKKPAPTRLANTAQIAKGSSVTLNAAQARPPIVREVAPQAQESFVTPTSIESSAKRAEEFPATQSLQVAIAPAVVKEEAMKQPVAVEAPTPPKAAANSNDSPIAPTMSVLGAPSTLATSLSNGKLKLVKYVPPVYPSAVRSQNTEGWLDVGFVVTGEGRVIEPHIKNGTLGPQFHRAAFDAVTQWKFAHAPNSDREAQPVVVHLKFKTPK